MELFNAHNQWATRPSDERYDDLPTMHNDALSYRNTARTSSVEWGKLRTEAQGEALTLIGPKGNPALMTHWALGQFAQRVGAPAAYIRTLPPTLAAQNLNHGLKTKGDGEKAQLLLHQNGGLLIRAATSERYTRIWNHEVVERLLPLGEMGWTLPPAGMDIGHGPATGLYLSDHDMFAFLIRDDRRIDDGTEQGLARGVFVINSEVGAKALAVWTFFYRYICGNHIVWGAENVSRLRIRHVGQADTRFRRELVAELTRYADESTSEDEARIKSAQRFVLGEKKEDVLDAIFRSRIDVSRKMVGDAYDVVDANAGIDGDPRSAWGIAQGLTRLSQDTPYADVRAKMDRAAGRVLEMAF
jgi:hypothetical protein